MKAQNIIKNNISINKKIFDYIIFKESQKKELYNLIEKSNYKNRYTNIINFISFNIIMFSLLNIIECGFNLNIFY